MRCAVFEVVWKFPASGGKWKVWSGPSPRASAEDELARIKEVFESNKATFSFKLKEEQ